MLVFAWNLQQAPFSNKGSVQDLGQVYNLVLNRGLVFL